MTWTSTVRHSGVAVYAVRGVGLALLAWALAVPGCRSGTELTASVEGGQRPRKRTRTAQEPPNDAGERVDADLPAPTGASSTGHGSHGESVDDAGARAELDAAPRDHDSDAREPRGDSESGSTRPEPAPPAAAVDAGSHDDDAHETDAAVERDAEVDRDAAAGSSDAAMSDAGASDAGDRLTYYRDAKPIIDAKCTPCHYKGGIGPFPLTTFAEVSPNASAIHYDVEQGVMPPWLATGELGVYEGDRRLSPEQKSTLLRWVEDGALAGDPKDAAPAMPPDRRSLERVDLSLPIAGPYTPVLTPDDYRCFVLEWPYAQTRYITGLSIEPGRTQSVHHAILYLEPAANALSVLAQDAADPGPGFQCFSNVNSLTTWLTSYEPGGFGQALPKGLGFEVQPGSMLVLQIHYNSQNGVGPDRSRVDVQVADSVEHVGNVAQLVNPSWVLGLMPIPAGRSDVVHSWRGRPDALAAFETYDVHWVDLHMHTLGSGGSVSIIRGDLFGTREPLLEIPEWEFHWQQTYVLRQPVKLYPGDQLEVECRFDNSADHQQLIDGEQIRPRDVNWGEGTTDEMCLGNVLITPSR